MKPYKVAIIGFKLGFLSTRGATQHFTQIKDKRFMFDWHGVHSTINGIQICDFIRITIFLLDGGLQSCKDLQLLTWGL